MTELDLAIAYLKFRSIRSNEVTKCLLHQIPEINSSDDVGCILSMLKDGTLSSFIEKQQKAGLPFSFDLKAIECRNINNELEEAMKFLKSQAIRSFDIDGIKSSGDPYMVPLSHVEGIINTIVSGKLIELLTDLDKIGVDYSFYQNKA